MLLKDALTSAGQFSDLCPIAANAQLYVSWWGERRITVAGYEGNISVRDLENRVREILAKNLSFNQEERTHGTFIATRLKEMYTTGSEIVKTKNFFTRWLNSFIGDKYCFMPNPINLKNFDLYTIDSHFLWLYTREQYEEIYGPAEDLFDSLESQNVVRSSSELDKLLHSRGDSYLHWFSVLAMKMSKAYIPKHVHQETPVLGNGSIPLQAAVASAGRLSDLCLIADKAQSYTSFWGEHRITVPGYQGSVLIGDLSKRIEELVEINPHFNQEERSHGMHLIERLELLDFTESQINRDKSFFVLWTDTKTNLPKLQYIFRLYTLQQFQAVFHMPPPSGAFHDFGRGLISVNYKHREYNGRALYLPPLLDSPYKQESDIWVSRRPICVCEHSLTQHNIQSNIELH